MVAHVRKSAHRTELIGGDEGDPTPIPVVGNFISRRYILKVFFFQGGRSYLSLTVAIFRTCLDDACLQACALQLAWQVAGHMNMFFQRWEYSRSREK